MSKLGTFRHEGHPIVSLLLWTVNLNLQRRIRTSNVASTEEPRNS